MVDKSLDESVLRSEISFLQEQRSKSVLDMKILPHFRYMMDQSDLATQISVQTKEHPNLIRITRPFRTRWDLLTMLLALYNCMTVPFFVAFYEEEDLSFFAINTIIDLIFIVDIFLNFFTTYIDKNGDEVTDRARITRNYLRGYFWVDLVASVPIDNFVVLFMSLAGSWQFIQFSDLLKLVRIVRLSRIIRFTRTKDEFKEMMKLFQLILYLVIYVHLTGCIWFLLIKYDQEWVPLPDYGNASTPGMPVTDITDMYDAGIWRQYFMCFYHAVWLLTGGEVGPQTSLQAAAASVMIIMGALITAVMFGEIAVLMTNLNSRQAKLQENLNGALATMYDLQLPKQLMNQILDYLTSTHYIMNQQEEYETFQKFISPALLQEVNTCIYEPIIRKNYILHEEDKMKKVLIKRMRNIFKPPEDEIITEGTPAECLYFLVNGTCRVLVTDETKKSHKVCYLHPGAHFGEIGVVYNTLRTATVQAVGYCTIAELSKKDYERLIVLFPHIVNKFRRCTNIYNDPWKNYLLNILDQASYFTKLPNYVFNELVYFMEVINVKRGDYLFKPGEKSSQLYIVTEGSLELSLTINEKHLHLLKAKSQIQNIEKPPIVPKKNTNLNSYAPEFNLDVFSLEGLKSKAEVLTLVNNGEVVGSIEQGEEVPDHTNIMGDYLQEIILEVLEPGTLLFPNFMLIKDIHQFQCKALKSSTVYTLNTNNLDVLCKEYPEFREEIATTRDEVKDLHQHKKTRFLDYHYEGMNKTRHLLKSAVVRQLFSLRAVRKQAMTKIGVLASKIQAIQACEDAGNFDLADKVSLGQIPPHYILPDGTLDDGATDDNLYSSLSNTNPIIKAYKKIHAAMIYQGGSVVKSFRSVHRNVDQHLQKISDIDEQLSKMRDNLLTLLDGLGTKYPMKPGKSREDLMKAIEEALNNP